MEYKEEDFLLLSGMQQFSLNSNDKKTFAQLRGKYSMKKHMMTA